jgi:hypothetical protein
VHQVLVPRLPTFAAFARSVGDGVLAEGCGCHRRLV